jgi:ATP phosphoribosyltransferase regulatory subunit
MSAWVLPDHLADVLPAEARQLEDLRRRLLDCAGGYGYELVAPPLLEHLESLLSGAGQALDLQTFKLVDQASGRTLGLRADTTPQVARIDAHLLNRQGVTRLCYCGPVLHTRPAGPHASREPLQFGAEIYGHAALEADLEILQLALDSLRSCGVPQPLIDLADTRVMRSLFDGGALAPQLQTELHAALVAKDKAELNALTNRLPAPLRHDLLLLPDLYGDITILDEAEKRLQALPGLRRALSDLKWLAARLEGAAVTVDLADLRGWGYYTGPRFAMYARGASDALVRGGRYDAVGAIFGRERPAAGFSLDLKALTPVLPKPALRAAIRAPWCDDAGLRATVAELRAAGATVVSVLPGHESEVEEFACDRALVLRDGRWLVQTLVDGSVAS